MIGVVGVINDADACRGTCLIGGSGAHADGGNGNWVGEGGGTCA
jgi:hypothetical protein